MVNSDGHPEHPPDEEVKSKQEQREERRRKKRMKMPQHGRGLAKIYRDAVLKRLK
jgi:hypothetical protein